MAVAAMLALALSGGVDALWKIFATSNQLLAVLVLFLAALWLARQGRRNWFAIVPAIFMLVTTAASLAILFKKFWVSAGNQPSVLWVADVLLIVLTGYLLIVGAVRWKTPVR
jgi:carbon starvation protein